MNKFTFSHEFEDYYGKQTKICIESEDSDLTDILERFEDFLKGCGFHLKGKLVIEEESSE